MKTKITIEHCRHFDPKTMTRKDSCPRRIKCDSEYKHKHVYPCKRRIIECLKLYAYEPCYDYEN